MKSNNLAVSFSTKIKSTKTIKDKKNKTKLRIPEGLFAERELPKIAVCAKKLRKKKDYIFILLFIYI